VGLAAAASAQLLGAAVVIVGDLNPARLAQARAMGCETVDVSKPDPVKDQLAAILGECQRALATAASPPPLNHAHSTMHIAGEPEVDCGVDCVGFEARGGCGHHHHEQPAQVGD